MKRSERASLVFYKFQPAIGGTEAADRRLWFEHSAVVAGVVAPGHAVSEDERFFAVGFCGACFACAVVHGGSFKPQGEPLVRWIALTIMAHCRMPPNPKREGKMGYTNKVAPPSRISKGENKRRIRQEDSWFGHFQLWWWFTAYYLTPRHIVLHAFQPCGDGYSPLSIDTRNEPCFPC